VTKTDIAEAVEWDRETALANIRAVNPDALILETSARTGTGVAALLDVLTAPADGVAAVFDQTQLQEAP
jgi:hydrogenase nickel incorporation protein HypB